MAGDIRGAAARAVPDHFSERDDTYDRLTKTIRNLLTPQKRRKMFSTTPAAIDSLEPRRLLTVPGVINITNAEISRVGPIIVDWAADDSADNYDYWISDGRENNNLTGRPHLGSVNDNHLEFVGFDAFPGYEARIWIRGVNADGPGPWSSLERLVVPGGEVPGTPEPDFSDVREPKIIPGDSKSFYIPPVDQLLFVVDSADGFVTQEMAAWVTRDGEILSTQGEYLQHGGGNRDSVWFDYHVDSNQNIPDGLYRVWFRARNGVGESPLTEPVTIGVGASQPEITGPTANGQPARPEITWSPGVAGVDYHIWIQTEDGTVVTSQTGVSGTSFQPENDLADGIYFAYVRQYSTVGFGLPWSAPFQFQVGNSTLPQRPQLTMIPNTLGDDTEDFRPLFQWTTDPKAVRYDLYVSDGWTGAAVIRETQLTEATFLGSALRDFDGYRAWLRAFGSDGTVTMWSEFVEFRVFSDGRVLPVGN